MALMLLVFSFFGANMSNVEATSGLSVYGNGDKPSYGKVELKLRLSIYVNGDRQSYSNLAKLEKGKTFVPLRGIFESLGSSVRYNSKDKTIDASKGNTKVWLKIGSRYAKVNGKTVLLDAPARIEKGSTLVPLRFISESLGAKVQWNQDVKTIKITNYTENLISAPTYTKLSRDSDDGITLSYLANNISGKTINYYILHLSGYKSFGLPSFVQIIGEGPVYPGEEIGMHGLFIYQSAIQKKVIDKIDIQFSDGTKATQRYDHSITR